MEISLKNLILAGIGTIAYSYEKGADIVDNLIKKGEITVNQGKEINEELKRRVDKERQKNESCNLITPETLKEILSSLDLATKKDLQELADRISKLENK